MKLDVDKDLANSLGAILVAFRRSRILDADKQPIVGGEFVDLYNHVTKVYKFRERILKADEGGLGSGELVDNEPIEEKPEQPKVDKKKKGKK